VYIYVAHCILLSYVFLIVKHCAPVMVLKNATVNSTNTEYNTLLQYRLVYSECQFHIPFIDKNPRSEYTLLSCSLENKNSLWKVRTFFAIILIPFIRKKNIYSNLQPLSQLEFKFLNSRHRLPANWQILLVYHQQVQHRFQV
jgi:hypothetical protein